MRDPHSLQWVRDQQPEVPNTELLEKLIAQVERQYRHKENKFPTMLYRRQYGGGAVEDESTSIKGPCKDPEESSPTRESPHP